ncbi:ABC transporter substrate-binding protein [Labilibaculum euxinus]
MIQKLLTAFICIMALLACNSGSKKQVDDEYFSKTGGFNFAPNIKYSDLFNIELVGNYKRITVTNPWQESDTLSSYILIQKGTKAPANTPKADFVIPVPIDEMAILSSTHIGFVDLLGELDKISGITNGNQIYNKYLNDRFKNGEIVEIGHQMGSHLESILGLFPELLMKTGFDNVREEDSRIVDAGIPIAYNIEWMESCMLARAEWIKFVGAFFNKDREADSIFNVIEHNYNEIKQIAKIFDNKPTALSGNDFKGTWYMPGGNSYAAKLIIDAGGDYHYKNESSKGSMPLSFEVVLDNMADADYWFGPRAKSLKELEKMDERYKLFKAFKNGNVYTINGRVNEYGGNDYWESGVARPDIILKDLIKILHPEILPEHELFYYKKLQ